MTEQEILAAQPELLALAEKVQKEKWSHIQLVKHFFTDFTDQQCDQVLWECTGYPAFFSLRKGQNSINAEIEQVFQAKVLRDRGEITCARCGAIMAGIFMSNELCAKCTD